MRNSQPQKQHRYGIAIKDSNNFCMNISFTMGFKLLHQCPFRTDKQSPLREQEQGTWNREHLCPKQTLVQNRKYLLKSPKKISVAFVGENLPLQKKPHYGSHTVIVLFLAYVHRKDSHTKPQLDSQQHSYLCCNEFS